MEGEEGRREGGGRREWCREGGRRRKVGVRELEGWEEEGCRKGGEGGGEAGGLR